jgi:hypothetical protein
LSCWQGHSWKVSVAVVRWRRDQTTIGRFVDKFRIKKFRWTLSVEAAIWASLMALAAANDGGRDGVFATVVNNDDNAMAMAMAMAVMAFTSVVAAVIGCGNGYSLATTRADMGESKRGCNGEAVMGEGG